eukprot:m51a1_g8711 hypothetical protein (1046) ;mRNA; r:124461-128041
MRTSYLLLALAALGLACDLQCQWSEFKAKYGKKYTVSEDAARLEVFARNVERIARLNSQGNARFAVNAFSDLSPEESNIPDSYFAPSVTPVRNQQQCGSCWTFASMGVLEAVYKAATQQTQQFSTQQLVDCAKTDSNGQGAGCSGGNYQMAFDYLKQHAAMLESAYPYTARNGACQDRDAGLTKVVSWNYVGWDDETQVMSAVMTYGPIGVTLNGAQISDYSSGVLSTSDGTCSDQVDHAVVLVGWTTVGGVPAWIIKNSWGNDWGVKPVGWQGTGDETTSHGFMYVKRGGEGCGITQYPAAYVQQTDAKAAPPSGSGSAQCAPKTAAAACPANAQCGSASDGCTGSVSCGSCASGFACQNNQCVSKCTPRDVGQVCRGLGWACGQVDLGCNVAGSCGDCSQAQGGSGGGFWGLFGGQGQQQQQAVCQNGQCVSAQSSCSPNANVCDGKQCGTYDDGCGNRVLCGSCASGSICNAGTCVAACTPSNSCSASGFTCGLISDGCSGSVSCGTCPAGQRCVNNVCAARPASCTPRTREQLCGSGAQCGPTVSDGCGRTVDCGKCASGFFCSAGQCSQTCSPRTAQQACDASWQCGSASDGCGNAVQCGRGSGTCAAGFSCSAHRCVKVSNDDWAQAVPAGPNAGWTVGPTPGIAGSVTVTSTSDTEKHIAWTSSAQWSRSSFVAYSFFFRASGPATLGVGARLGKQPYGDGDCLFWRLSIDGSNNAQLRQFAVLQGNEQQGADDNGPFGVAFAWDASREHNLTVSFHDDGSSIVMVPSLDGQGIYNGAWDPLSTTSYSQSPSSYWSNTGAAFVVLAGRGASARTAGAPASMATRATVALQLPGSATQSAVRNYVKRTLFVGDRAIESLARDAATGAWNVTLRDSRRAVAVGGSVVGFISQGTPSLTYAQDLADTLVYHVNEGNPAASGFPATHAAVVASPALPTTAAVHFAAISAAGAAGGAAGGLSGGAIAGIVIGSVAGAVLVAAAVGTAVYVATLPEPSEPMPADFQPRNPFRKTAYKVKAKKGVDVINMDKDHRSITARAPPIA